MRYKYLDVAKGITLIFIMMAHSCWFPFGLERYCTAYFVILFFVISGYLQNDIRPDKNYLYKKFCKIIIPYFMYNILIYVIYVLWKGFDTPKDALKAVLGIIYSTHCLYFPIETENNIFFFLIKNDPTWFLTTFFCSSMVFGFYIRYGLKTNVKILMFVLFAAITQVLYWLPIFLPWGLDKAFIGADCMIVGYEMRKTGKRKIELKWKEYAVMFSLLVLYKILTDFNPGIGLSIREYGNRGIFSVVLCLLIGVTGSLCCIWGSSFISKIPCIGTVAALIGKESLVIMSMHLIIFQIYDEVLQQRLPQNHGNCYYWYFSFCRIAITCAIIIGVTYAVRYAKGRIHKKLRKETMRKGD